MNEFYQDGFDTGYQVGHYEGYSRGYTNASDEYEARLKQMYVDIHELAARIGYLEHLVFGRSQNG